MNYTKISNDYIEWITSQVWLTGLDSRILLFIFRKTIGWNKEVDKISLSQFQKVTSSSRQGVLDAINRLEKHKAIVIHKCGKGKISQYQLVNCSCITSQVELTSRQARTSQPQLTYKRNKETIQNDFKKLIEGRKLIGNTYK
jgi:phage replication O-like protein O